MVQFVYNSTDIGTIKVSPFYANYRYKLEAYKEPISRPEAQLATERATKIRDL